MRKLVMSIQVVRGEEIRGMVKGEERMEMQMN